MLYMACLTSFYCNFQCIIATSKLRIINNIKLANIIDILIQVNELLSIDSEYCRSLYGFFRKLNTCIYLCNLNYIANAMFTFIQVGKIVYMRMGSLVAVVDCACSLSIKPQSIFRRRNHFPLYSDTSIFAAADMKQCVKVGFVQRNKPCNKQCVYG